MEYRIYEDPNDKLVPGLGYYALRDIEPGEELTVSYYPMDRVVSDVFYYLSTYY
jgi:SET domain-containing protein